MIRTLIFDFDGVLVESVDVKTRAFAALFADEGPSVVTQVVRYHLANGGLSRYEKFHAIYRDILRRPLSAPRFQQLCDRFAQLVIEGVIAAPWVQGAIEFLETFKSRYDFHIVSATPQGEIDHIVAARGIRHYFGHVLGSPRKKVVLLEEILKNSHLRPGEAVYIGDATNDWTAAQEVNLPFIWRKAADGIVQLDGFPGPSITFLTQLEDALADVCQALRYFHSHYNEKSI